MDTTIRVLLVDDHAILRAGLRVLLEAERDIEVVGEAASGEIGGRLGLSHKMVDTYRQRLMSKLGLHRRSQVVHFALDHGLLAAATA